MNPLEKLPKHLEWLSDRTIYLAISGSISQGLNTEFSDTDYRGICIPPKKYFLGFLENFEQYITSEPSDTTIFNIQKFFALAHLANPNVLEMLFVEPEHRIVMTDAGKVIIDNRDKFLSRNAKERFIGYAKSQAHRIKNHKRWIDGNFGPPPTREEFGLPAQPLIDKNQMLAVNAELSKELDKWNVDWEPFSEPQKIYLKRKVSDILAEMKIVNDDKWQLAARKIGLDENFIHHIQKEKEYRRIVDDYASYKEWKAKRNPKRAAMEAKVGYDAKHACSLIRLLVMGKEILQEGKLQVKRTTDRDWLMEIKNCQWPYEKVIETADKIEKEVEEAYKRSKLPEQPDYRWLDNLCIELIDRANR